ncbi:SCO6880 family protein, partial [Rhodococcus qingshengii]
RVETTEQARQEQVRGAGLVRYSALMTITCATATEVPNASSILESLSARAMLKLVRAYGMQDAAFAAGLGVGVLLGDHTTTSKIARNG